MKRKISYLLLSMIFMMLAMNNIVYAKSISVETMPYGPKIEDLKGKDEIIKNLENIKRIRANLIVVAIKENSTNEELQALNKDLESYLNEINKSKRNLEQHKITYKDSFPDVFFAEEISFIAESYIISIRQQQNLIRQLQLNQEEAKKLFYSGYLIPVYYYLTLGDQMVTYIETYFVIS
ncbi:hypothetical protein [Clostridium intestinale]|jgi:hypothetical protein|uniref:Uncharacterized protein n=1 Tax=Clostridium intestinale URNW TaxID=1294142 RepID=U2NSU5_9CLOT|nr:hypothetical protein [Clostridium intestinale]ERK31936.1 hypothetical protein CINTURNW_0686 [Clostridium intestinale URNW]